MDISDLSSCHEIKDLLKLWIDPEQEHYAYQKERLKDSGISLKATISENYLPLLFEGSHSKNFENSLITSFFSRLLHTSRVRGSAVLRMNFLGIVIFKDDLLDITIKTPKGILLLKKTTIFNEITEDQINQIVPSELVETNKNIEIELHIKLVDDGALRTEAELASCIYDPEQWIDLIHNKVINSFKTDWSRLSKPLLQRRLDFYQVEHPDNIPRTLEISNSKNIYLYTRFSNEMSTETIWFRTNEHCLLHSQRIYEDYIIRSYKIRQLLSLNVVDLGEVSI